MKKLFTLLITSFHLFSFSQYWFEQKFDGTDTIPSSTLNVEIDSNATDIWHIGKPQKNIFDNAYSIPNVLVTDTVNFIPDSTTASFTINLDELLEFEHGIIAIQWQQKLDLDSCKEFGLIEYSSDSGNTWKNVFEEVGSNDIENFYGFLPNNEGYSPYWGFTNTDTVWRNIWLCFNYDFNFNEDNLRLKFTLQTDTIEHNSEGWMIDNFTAFFSFFHTVGEISGAQNYDVYPNPAEDYIHFTLKDPASQQKISNVMIVDLTGRIVFQYVPNETSFSLPVHQIPKGRYNVKIIMENGFEVHQIIIN